MRLLHTMIRVGDLQRAIDFYTKVLGMRLLRTSENQSTNTRWLSSAIRKSEGAVIELTYNWDTDSYDMGTAFGHLALGVDDVAATCDSIRRAGGKVTREAGPVKGGTTVIAFVEDPDGYKIELIENKHAGQGLGH